MMIKQIFVKLLSSKKATLTIASIIVAACAKVGLTGEYAIDAESLAGILSPVLAYILGQSYVDREIARSE